MHKPESTAPPAGWRQAGIDTLDRAAFTQT